MVFRSASSALCLQLACALKYSVLIPQPQQHDSGSEALQLGQAQLLALEQAARAASAETWAVVSAQLIERLPMDELPSGAEIEVPRVHFEHALEKEQWQGIRERNESYGLEISKQRISVDARSAWALSNAMATLYQLMEIKGTKGRKEVKIPEAPHRVVDAPAFPHRGVLLDTSRTFYPVAWIKDLVTAMSEFKLNVLHLHLTDTAAWSFEVESHPYLAQNLSYRDINSEAMVYSRQDVRELVEFARLRGVSLLPEVDGPAHAPALAAGELTVAATADFSTEDYAVEPPPGTWNFSSSKVTGLLADVFSQLEEDFTTAPFIHVGGDEPRASSLCEALGDEKQKQTCLEQCTSKHGGSPYSQNCAPMPSRPSNAAENKTFWFPDVLNEKVQKYFDDVSPSSFSIPRSAWSGVREDMAAHLSKKTAAKPMLQLWQFPQPGQDFNGMSEEDCEAYDIVQSSATHPLGEGKGYSDQGWLYLECGEGQNWISMGKSYWCSRANWVSMYALNITQHRNPVLQSEKCQKAFIGAEVAVWGEISGPGNTMAFIFPRAVAFAERVWSNPQALTWDQLASGSAAPPASYWPLLKSALHRLNTVVENFALQGHMVDRLQPKFCFDHPEYCDNYTLPYLPKAPERDTAVLV